MIELNNGLSGVAYIENVPGNNYSTIVRITLDDSGETVYESEMLFPDEYIDVITLNQRLPQGTYPATATFTAYDPETGEEVSAQTARITLVARA